MKKLRRDVEAKKGCRSAEGKCKWELKWKADLELIGSRLDSMGG
jgi:hypothetical protein